MSRTVSAIDYKALAERIAAMARSYEDRSRLARTTQEDGVSERHSECAADLRTVVSLLEGMAEEKSVAWVEVADAYEGPYSFHGQELLPTGRHSLFMHPEPQPQIDHLTRERDEAREQVRYMVEKAASDGVLDGYRELGARAAAAENERDEARAERDALAKQAGPFRRLVDACKLLSSEAEEYEFDDGIGRGAMLDYWHEFDRKLDAALAQIEELRRQLDPSGEYASADDLIAALRAEAAEDEAVRWDAERYRFLACKGVPPHSLRWSRWRLEYWNGEWWDPLMKEELDAAIDAQIEKERSESRNQCR